MKKIKLTKKQLTDAYQGLREGGYELEELSVTSVSKVHLPNGDIHKKTNTSLHPLAKPFVNEHKTKPKWNYETKLKMK
jgi:hypothetical protein